MPPETRRRIAAKLASELAKRPEVLLAIIHGGFTQRKFFRDIDVAVYTAGKISYRDEPYYTYTLSTHLSKLARVPVDVKLLDYAPPSFRTTVLAKGQPLLERKPGLRWSLLLRAKDELRGLKRHQDRTRHETPRQITHQ